VAGLVGLEELEEGEVVRSVSSSRSRPFGKPSRWWPMSRGAFSPVRIVV
jgi:hypothetical protein